MHKYNQEDNVHGATKEVVTLTFEPAEARSAPEIRSLGKRDWYAHVCIKLLHQYLAKSGSTGSNSKAGMNSM